MSPLRIRLLIILVVVLSLAAGSFYVEKKDRVVLEQTFLKPMVQETKTQAKEDVVLPFSEGETITYTIKSLGLKAGEARLVFNGVEKVDGQPFYSITFTSRAANFFDEEKIYADLDTFYPVIVKRDLNIWGKKEKITEKYDQKKGIIKIIKTAGDKTTEQMIEKTGPIDNIYCFIYRYRKNGTFQVGESFSFELPTASITIDLVKSMKLKVGGGTYESYYMQSNPSKYKVWFDRGEKKIPLRIDGAMGLSKMAMVMEDYESK